MLRGKIVITDEKAGIVEAFRGLGSVLGLQCAQIQCPGAVERGIGKNETVEAVCLRLTAVLLKAVMARFVQAY